MLSSAISRAMAIREEAREEAELTLRKASAEGRRRAADALRIEREGAAAEREFVRLRTLTEEIQVDLAGFLTKALEQLRNEPETKTGEGDATHAMQETLTGVLGAAVRKEGAAVRKEGDDESSGDRPASPMTSV